MFRAIRANRRLSDTLPKDPTRRLGGKPKHKKQTTRTPFDLKIVRRRGRKGKRVISYKSEKLREFKKEVTKESKPLLVSNGEEGLYFLNYRTGTYDKW